MKIQQTNLNSVLDDITINRGDIENLLSYYEIDNKNYQNLNQAIILDYDEYSYEIFHLNTDMYWPQISYLIYNTTSLYWLLMQINPELVNGFNKIKAPNHIKYLPNAIEIIEENV